MRTSSAPARKKKVFTKEQGLSAAVELCDLAGVETLLSDGVDVNAANESGMTPLMRAACTGRTEIIQKLLESGAALNAKRADGFTALFFASFFGHVDAVRLLLDRGADITAKSKFGTSAEMWASARGFNEVFVLLKQARTGTLPPSAPAPKPKPEPVNQERIERPLRNLAQPVESSAAIESEPEAATESFEITAERSHPIVGEPEELSAPPFDPPSAPEFGVADIWASEEVEPKPRKLPRVLPQDGLEYLPEVAPSELELSGYREMPTWSWTRLTLVTIIVMLVCGLATFAVLQLLRQPAATDNNSAIETLSTITEPGAVAATETEAQPPDVEAEVEQPTTPNRAEPEEVIANPTFNSRRRARDRQIFQRSGTFTPDADRIFTVNKAEGIGVEDLTEGQVQPAPLTVESKRPRAVTTAPPPSAELTVPPSTNTPVSTERPKRKVIQWP